VAVIFIALLLQVSASYFPTTTFRLLTMLGLPGGGQWVRLVH